jgi:hypothetical protein
MKSTDLRIGNLILKNNEIYEISSLFFVDLHDGTIRENNNYVVKPITLTEEWLLKFGKIDWISKDIDGIYFWFNGEKKYIKFVHSLQNTYFCIEQKELI